MIRAEGRTEQLYLIYSDILEDRNCQIAARSATTKDYPSFGVTHVMAGMGCVHKWKMSRPMVRGLVALIQS